MSYSFLDIIYKVNQMIKANLSPQQVDQTIINTFLGPKNSQTKETQEAPALKSEFRISNIPQFNNLIISSQQRSFIAGGHAKTPLWIKAGICIPVPRV